MADQTKAVQKQEAKRRQDMESIRDRATFVPRADIYERENDYVLLAEMPGVSHDSVDINFENNELTITGRAEEVPVEGHTLLHREYEVGDYQRSFRYPDNIDAEKIDARMSNGVLRVTLPKSEKAKPKKIAVRVE